MKIGIVTEYYYPLLGGITENVHNTRLLLEKMGDEVKIITSNHINSTFTVHKNHDKTDPDIIRIGKSIPAYSNGSFAHLTVGTRLGEKMRTILHKEKFDLLHLHSPIVFTLPPIAILKAKCPIVGTFHTYFDSNLIYSIFKGKIQSKFLDRIDGKIVVAKSCSLALSRYFEINARVIPNGVNVDQFSPEVPHVEKFDGNKMNLLFLSRFDPRNGLALMIRAFEIVKSRFPDVRLIVVGDGPLRLYYQHLIPGKLKHDIHFEGLKRDSRPNYYATCDVFCSPISKASFGVTLLEAMASGKPIVATENIGYKEILSPNEGVLVANGKPDEFAREIITLLKDDQLRKEMGTNGRRKAITYSWNKVVCDIKDYYHEIMQK